MLQLSTTRYVYFDEEGSITQIGNSFKEGKNYIKVEYNEVANLINGKEVVSNYVVIFDNLTKAHKLMHRFIEDEHRFDINDQIYQIPNTSSSRPDITITQDIKNSCWQIKLDDAISDNLRKGKLVYKSQLGFSITNKNDPHVLHQFISVNTADLANDVFKFKFLSDLELDENAISIYTIKRFEEYYHEVLL
jgi:hypothetical protein